MRLRSNLVVLVVGALLPLVVVATIGAFALVERERTTFEREAIGRLRAAMSAVEAEQRGVVSLLSVLGSSPALQGPDPAAFSREARAVVKSQPYWTNAALYSAAGARLADAAHDDELPAAVEPLLLAAAAGASSPAFMVGDAVPGPRGEPAAVRIYLPVKAEAGARYVVVATVRPELFADVLRAQQLSAEWVIGLADRRRRFVARLPPLPAGSPVAPTFRDALERAREGFYRGLTKEGLDSYTAYVSSPGSGWGLGIAMPADFVNAGARQLSWALASGLVLALACALALAVQLATRVAAPIVGLARATPGLGRAGHVVPADTGHIDEIQLLQRGMVMAQQAMADREALLEREKAALQASDRAKDEFIAMLSHELRNPLAALTSAAYVLKASSPPAQRSSHAVEVVVRQARHMSRLIEDLLDVSRILMGKVQLARAPFDLAELVRETTQSWAAAGQTARCKVDLALTPTWVDGDRERIGQVYANLLGNAVKFSASSGSIRVEVAPVGDRATLTVSDEGEGFEPAATAWMFDLFAQGAQTIERAKGGLGIGLAVVKRLVTMHGGAVTASSAGTGRGAAFVVALPCVAAPARTATPQAQAAASTGKRVLLIDDNDDVREMLTELLAMDGHEVRTEAGGRAGVAAAIADPPDVALIDIGMPDVDGYAVARTLRADPRCAGVTLIALTGYGQAEDRRRSQEAGFDLHLVKPVDPDELSALLNRHSTG